jgi:hypothetical protein
MNNPPPGQSAVDLRVKLYKAISGLIPGGSFLVEYLIERVPSQRAERLGAYIEQLNSRLERLENHDFIETYEYAALVENSIIEATKPISERRLGWISSIVVPASPPSELEIEFRRKALQILSDLSDADLECLIAHRDFSSKVRMERAMPVSHFISYADAKKLPAQDLFIKHLENFRLELYRDALLEKHLLTNQTKNGMTDYKLSERGMLFVFVLGEESSVR